MIVLMATTIIVSYIRVFLLRQWAVCLMFFPALLLAYQLHFLLICWSFLFSHLVCILFSPTLACILTQFIGSAGFFGCHCTFSLPNWHLAYFTARLCCLYANCIWHYEFVKQSLLHFMRGLWSHSNPSFCLRWRRCVTRTTKNSHYACVIRNTLGAQIDWFVNGTPNGA